MTVTGDAAVGLSVKDSRPYILSNDKNPNFVGLQRGGFANPFNVTTTSGEPMVDDFEKSIAQGLTNKGFAVTRLDLLENDPETITLSAQKNELKRVIVLNVLEWKSDVMMQITLHHNLVLSVYDEAGSLIAQSQSSDTSGIGDAKFQSGNAKTVLQSFEHIIGKLFRDPMVKQALQEIE